VADGARAGLAKRRLSRSRPVTIRWPGFREFIVSKSGAKAKCKAVPLEGGTHVGCLVPISGASKDEEPIANDTGATITARGRDLAITCDFLPSLEIVRLSLGQSTVHVQFVDRGMMPAVYIDTSKDKEGVGIAL